MTCATQILLDNNKKIINLSYPSYFVLYMIIIKSTCCMNLPGVCFAEGFFCWSATQKTALSIKPEHFLNLSNFKDSVIPPIITSNLYFNIQCCSVHVVGNIRMHKTSNIERT